MTFENLLLEARQRKVLVTLTARVVQGGNKGHRDYKTRFSLDSRNCPEDDGSSPTDEKTEIRIATGDNRNDSEGKGAQNITVTTTEGNMAGILFMTQKKNLKIGGN